ncbi:RNA polymerase sigma-54 factor RpoN [Cupriavidus sp. U2]|uniref:sigma-70 family RNA polymerase sigma factor n=1 Tax=Cupriavidus sp. U2 TaxID=2920269 RepID=UPI00129D6681|nr:sigma-70 family RNA polymerase sigma factor [Cupriavidus sp. U2]KAI3591419.1 RNA polymerase sigma-54 factor RpoN [Cupriavidus sp. U2]
MDNDFSDDALREVIPRLRRFAVSLTRNEASADDLVQACLERALSRRVTRRDGGDLRAWLFSILYRLFLDGQRRARRYAGLLTLFGVGSDEDSAPSTEDVVLTRSALDNFNQLSAEQRALLMLVTVEGLSYQEAADALDVPIGTVMSRISRARKALRELTDGKVVHSPLQVLK